VEGTVSRRVEPQLLLAEATARAIADVLTGLGISSVEVGKPAMVPHGENPLEILPLPAVLSKVAYVGGVSGGNVLATSLAGANQIAAAMGAGNNPADVELSDIAQSAFSEAANQMLSSASAATSAVLGRTVEVSPPEVTVVTETPDVADVAAPHMTRVSLTAAGETCLFVQLIPQSFVMRMSQALDDGDSRSAHEDALDGPPLDSGWVYGTSLRLDAELGCARLTADEVLGLRDGAVVVLDRAVDDPVELFVNGTPYGTGRLLLDEGEWAVKIEEIAPPQPDNPDDAVPYADDAIPYLDDIVPAADDGVPQDESEQVRMENDTVDESVEDTEGSG
jgi:flagellar motor switch protein FliN/FliY